MTNEETIKNLKKLKSFHNGSYGTAIDFAIKALEQTELTPSYNSVKSELKPSEDCISRDEAIRVAEQGQIQGYEWQFKQLCNLPSVTPEIPKGKWIDDSKEDSYYANCSHCGYQIDTHYERGYLNYCPNCGLKMEDKE